MSCLAWLAPPPRLDLSQLSASELAAAVRDPLPRMPRAARAVVWDELLGLRWLASGGSCEVWAATLLGEEVAVKVVTPELAKNEAARRDVLKEAEHLSALCHRHVLQLIGSGQTEDGRPFLVLERVASVLSDELPKPLITLCGEPERDEVGICEWWPSHMAKVRRWPLRRGLLCALDLAQAFAHLHDAALPGERLLHRDLKPDNVGFLQDGTLVLFDFGLATRWALAPGEGEGEGAAEPDAPRPLTGKTGSVRYMAPEVLLSQPYSCRAEVFSWATLVWQLLSHQRPFRGMSEATFCERVAEGGERPNLPPAWPSDLRSLLTDCWSAEAKDRPCFAQVVERLKNLFRASGALPAAEEPEEGEPRRAAAAAITATSRAGAAAGRR